MNVVLLLDTPLIKIIKNMEKTLNCEVGLTLARRTFTS
jgi:hypothetical protein